MFFFFKNSFKDVSVSKNIRRIYLSLFMYNVFKYHASIPHIYLKSSYALQKLNKI